MSEEVVTVVTIVVETPDREEAQAAVDAVAACLGSQVARRYPLEEYPSFPTAGELSCTLLLSSTTRLRRRLV